MSNHPDLDNRCVSGLYEMEGVRASWIFIMTSPVYWLWYGGHTQVRLSGLQELGREEGGSEIIAHIRDIKESAGSRQLDRWRWCLICSVFIHSNIQWYSSPNVSHSLSLYGKRACPLPLIIFGNLWFFSLNLVSASRSRVNNFSGRAQRATEPWI